jgi:hypothetical protein
VVGFENEKKKKRTFDLTSNRVEKNKNDANNIDLQLRPKS